IKYQAFIVLFFDALDIRIQMQVNTLALHLVLQRMTEISIQMLEKPWAAIDQFRFGTQSVKNPGKLDADIAATHYCHTARKLIQIENLIGGNGMLDAGNVRQPGPTTNGNQDMSGTVACAV